jgi:TrmH family RNA methyltransferase
MAPFAAVAAHLHERRTGAGAAHVEGTRVTTLGLNSPLLEPVRDLRTKKGRREQGRFAVEGATMLAEALAAGRRPLAVYVTEAGRTALPASADLEGVVFTVPDRAMARLSDVETPPGILAVFPLVLASLDSLLGAGLPGIVLAGVADPGNAGTLLRSAEIFGLPSAKVVRASMGAIFRMRLAVAEPVELVFGARRAGYSLVAAGHDGEPLPSFQFADRTLIAIGHERHGVTSLLPEVDRTVTIPQPGRGESLNAAMAGAIIFYEFSQRLSIKTS